MTAMSKNIYVDVLNDIVDEYSNKYHSTTKMKPIKSDSYAESNMDSNDKDPNFKIGDHVRISKYENIFAKGYAFCYMQNKKYSSWTYFISDLNGERIVGTFYEKEFQKINQQEFRIEKLIKRKSDKLYVKWKSCDSSFNSWIDKKDIV